MSIRKYLKSYFCVPLTLAMGRPDRIQWIAWLKQLEDQSQTFFKLIYPDIDFSLK